MTSKTSFPSKELLPSKVLPALRTLTISERRQAMAAPLAMASSTLLGKRPLAHYRHYPQDSLARLMMANLHHRPQLPQTLTADSKQENQRPSTDEVDYGYETQESAPPSRATKRRRMNRRNSKTPAMLMAMSASIAAKDFLGETKRRRRVVDVQQRQPNNNVEKSHKDDSYCRDDMAIADVLARHFKARRTSGANPATFLNT
eukprot:CAMPEP_0168734418 /NCGR_PEP_ID=MMETSP0724-20121128/8803_1 /TAXON_ID=265536 /ORGANISM="Amphiprora sp., Strain CCMP467" /LENGTH=201 /DNA_ID=CAMNT_0008781521 /DNA_START=85 /DNA_END=690 /DNA_ORIENTATION=-